MPYRTGDIDELYGWSDDDDLGAYEMPEEKCVGTEASFEQLLARELAKEHGQNGCGKNTTISTTTKSRRQFLKKGARGWWMENATAKQKLQKHVLESVIMDEDNQVAHYEVARQAKSPPKRRQRSPHTSSIGTASPEPARRDDVASVHISPVRLPPATRPTAEPPRRSLPMWANGHQNLRTDESIETLNLSRVRQDFEHQREREADELADFEALEQELAAEKASYLQEKRVIDDRRQGSTTSKAYEDGEDDNASWLRDSIDGASLHGDAQQFLASSFSNNLDLGGESAMVFEGDHRVFRSPLPQERPVGRESQRPRQSRRSFAPSEISAVSLNDSEPWGDANALDHFAHLPESPIAKLDTASIRRESLWNKEEEADRRINNQDHFEDSQSYQDDDDEVKSTERGHARNAPSRHDAPISSLVQQVFGGAPQSEASWDDDVYQPSTQPPPTNSRQAVLRGSSKKPPNGPSSRPPRSVQGQKASRQSAPRNQRAAEEQPELPAPTRRRAPGFGSDGMLPVSIEEKLVELEEEVKFYKSETLQLQRKKAQYDDELQRLARDKENIVHYQDEQQQLIEQEWQRQRQKMKQDERLFERQMKLKLSAAASAGSRKDRAEMDALKAQIVALQLEAKQSSGKMKATNDVLRQRIADLEGKNRELSEEIKFLERDRLDQWQKYEDLLKELNSHKLKQDDRRDQLKTVGDISRVSRSAEELLSSLQFPNPDVTQSRSSEPSKSTASTPTYDHGDEYNPGQYRQAGRDQVKSVHSSHSSGKHNQDEDDDGGRQLEPNTRCEEDATVDEVVHPGGKREMTYRDGTKRIFFADGNEKEILPNGDVVIRFTNGDRKEFFPSTGVSVYHYHEAQTTLTTFPDKTKVYEFPNQQIEKSYLDGTTEIQFADGILKTIHPSGDEFSRFPDGTTMLETKDGLREVTLLNGKQVRYYPDGKMTLVNVDGQESEVRSDEELRELMETV